MPNVYQIREKLSDWINGKISLAEFEDWFVPATWNVHRSGDEAAENLVDEIELNLSEYSGGYLSREQLVVAMRSALAVSPIYVIESQAHYAKVADQVSRSVVQVFQFHRLLPV